jgi:hypothetical protein
VSGRNNVWLLRAPEPPIFLIPDGEGHVSLEVSSRSLDLVDLIDRVVEARGFAEVSDEEWRSVKKGASKLLADIGPLAGDLKDNFGLERSNLLWQLIFRYSNNKVSFQPWVEVDYWYVSEAVDKVMFFEDSAPRSVAISALRDIIDQLPSGHFTGLKSASWLWPDSRELAFQGMGETAGQTVGRFLDYVISADLRPTTRSIPKLEIGEFPSWFVWSPSAIDDLTRRSDRIR